MQKVSFEEVYGNRYIQESVKSVVKQVVKSFPILASRADDMVQELWLNINRACEKYSRDGKAGIESFFRGVIDRRINNIRRMYLLQLYSGKVQNDNADMEEALHITCKSNVKLLMLKMDLAVVMSRLSPELRQVCHLIMAGETLAAIARQRGLSESKFFYQCVYPLRTAFKEEGLDFYLDLI